MKAQEAVKAANVVIVVSSHSLGLRALDEASLTHFELACIASERERKHDPPLVVGAMRAVSWLPPMLRIVDVVQDFGAPEHFARSMARLLGAVCGLMGDAQYHNLVDELGQRTTAAEPPPRIGAGSEYAVEQRSGLIKTAAARSNGVVAGTLWSSSTRRSGYQ